MADQSGIDLQGMPSSSITLASGDFFVRREQVETHALPDGSLLLYEANSGTAFPLNESGGRIWELCREPRSLEEVVDLLSADYEGSRGDLDRDAREFLAVLVAHGLLSIQSPPC